MQGTRPRPLHGTLINRHGFAGRPGRPLGDNGIGHLHGFDHACHSTGHLHGFDHACHGTGHLHGFDHACHSTGHLRGTTGSFSRHHIGNGNGRAFAGTLIGTSARNRRPVTRALTVPGEGLCGIGHIP
ncbi:hypothetical protein [Streptomyces sp. NPDC056982]|uniref:hypothetical protein n=1 Tax=Streptomyces sp. NPDC056982 TaxID=3345986 RepID=UPI00362CC240